MFTINEDQIAVFATKSHKEFLDRMVEYVRDNFPLKFSKFGASTTRKHAEATMAEAKKHGFETERHIVSWLDLGMRHGKFWREPWAQEPLDVDSGSANRRMRKLQLVTLERVGETAR